METIPIHSQGTCQISVRSSGGNQGQRNSSRVGKRFQMSHEHYHAITRNLDRDLIGIQLILRLRDHYWQGNHHIQLPMLL